MQGPHAQSAVFIDAGFLLAVGSTKTTGTSLRSSTVVDTRALIAGIIARTQEDEGLAPMRVYWYDASHNGVMTDAHKKIALIDDVKVRLGRIGINGAQKGVDLRLGLDLVEVARNRSARVAYLFCGDDDIAEAVEAAQDQGMKVVLMGLEDAGRRVGLASVAEHLALQVDRILTLPIDVIRESFAPSMSHRSKESAEGITTVASASSPSGRSAPADADVTDSTAGLSGSVGAVGVAGAGDATGVTGGAAAGGTDDTVSAASGTGSSASKPCRCAAVQSARAVLAGVSLACGCCGKQELVCAVCGRPLAPGTFTSTRTVDGTGHTQKALAADGGLLPVQASAGVRSAGAPHGARSAEVPESASSGRAAAGSHPADATGAGHHDRHTPASGAAVGSNAVDGCAVDSAVATRPAVASGPAVASDTADSTQTAEPAQATAAAHRSQTGVSSSSAHNAAGRSFPKPSDLGPAKLHDGDDEAKAGAATADSDASAFPMPSATAAGTPSAPAAGTPTPLSLTRSSVPSSPQGLTDAAESSASPLYSTSSDRGGSDRETLFDVIEEVAQNTAKSWLHSASRFEIQEVLQDYPYLEPDLDRALLHDCAQRIGEAETTSQVVRKHLRDSFWSLVRSRDY